MTNPLVSFRDGKELVQFLEKHAGEDVARPCLLLLDLNMPLVDGFDVMLWLQSRPEFKNLPVAVITGSIKATDRDRAMEAGVTEFLEKFPTESDLARVVAWASSHPFPS